MDLLVLTDVGFCIMVKLLCTYITCCGSDEQSSCTFAIAIVVTLCTYAQQGYAFGRIRLYVCIFVYLYVCQQKNRLFSALPLENLSVIC